MPRDGAIFGDLIGKLDMLRIECAKCGRAGQYRLAVLIGKYGRGKKVFTWIDELTADCQRKIAKNANDPCEAHCPDLPDDMTWLHRPRLGCLRPSRLSNQ